MARDDAEQGLMPSLLDRLIDPESGGTAWRRGYGVDKIVQSVQRDLEELLNTRQSHMGLPPDLTEVQRSIVAYGLPDLTSLNAVTAEERANIGRVLEVLVAQFEPRLKEVHATMIDGGDPHERTVRFRLDAKLNVDPAPEVAFDTILELTTGHYSIQTTA